MPTQTQFAFNVSGSGGASTIMGYTSGVSGSAGGGGGVIGNFTGVGGSGGAAGSGLGAPGRL